MAETQTPQADPVAGLIDFPLPQEVSLLPQTWPSRIAIALTAAAIVLASWRLLRWYLVNRYRREALAELDAIRHATPPDQLAIQLSLLVRRTALVAFPRETVAPLAGPAWLAFLDRTSGGEAFSHGAGRLLASAPYRPGSSDPDQVEALADLVRRWIRTHHV